MGRTGAWRKLGRGRKRRGRRRRKRRGRTKKERRGKLKAEQARTYILFLVGGEPKKSSREAYIT